MPLGIIEIFAAIVIILGIIKLIVMLISPGSWFNFTKKIYSKPQVTSVISLILAGIVLFYLISAGISIIDIFAVMLFFILLVLVGVSQYAHALINWFSSRDLKTVLKEQWVFVLIWILLLIWGLVELIS